MNPKLVAISAISFFLGSIGLSSISLAGAPLRAGNPLVTQDQDRGGWDAPPGEFREMQRKGFRDGVEGARKDFDNHRRPDVNNREEYRHPDVPRGDRNDYRDGFRRGYEAGVAHLMNGGGPPR